ncbi:DUF4129 domain-containing protein, partial [Halorubrum sp. CBA1125]|uniref:transglutaminase TgpA family protein n=1 Tax=Halorubrum sp. CBA1125 TaxID=2668072 RepID=UPI00135D7547
MRLSSSLERGLLHPAVVGVVVVTAAYLGTFFGITDIVGGTTRTAVAVAVAGAGGLVLARVVDDRTALRLAALLLVVGLAGYYFAIPESRRALFSVRSVVLDTVALSTGLSVLRLTLAEVWVLAVAPVPTFLVGYFAGRGRHVAAAGVAEGTLVFLVLTGDAGATAAIAGAAGIALAVGLSTLSTPGRLRGHADTLGVVVVAMLITSATVTVGPAGAAQPWGVDNNPRLESTLSGDDELDIVGSTRLSPEVRYTIESPVERNWHTGAYDTYTGDGWVRSGEPSSVDGPLAGPPGETEDVSVTVTARTEKTLLPAPWKAVDVEGVGAGAVQVDERGTLRLAAPLRSGDRVRVESRVPDADPDALRNASTDYDPELEDRYTQLPDSTPDRVGERTEEILASADAETPYDQAVAIERYLRSEYEYSLTVERPEGDIADAFLFEMDAGYCTYFATTMVAMLRSQGVPARLETGYTTGEAVGEDRYVVRGQNAHAWVSIYVPDHGWVSFDPTPTDARDEARATRLAEARADGETDVDTTASLPEVTAESVGDDSASSTGNASAAENANSSGNTTAGITGRLPETETRITAENGTSASTNSSAAGRSTSPGGGLPLIPETGAYVLLVVAAAVVAGRHAGVRRRAIRRFGPLIPRRTGDPNADAKRAFADLEHLLARRYRERRPGETPRAYLSALRRRGLDERAEVVGEAYERAAYAGTVTREEADEARRTV